MSPPVRHLVVDVGNSGIKAACFVDGKLQLPIARFAPEDWTSVADMATNHRVNNIIYSTVANVPTDAWIDQRNASGQPVYTPDRSRSLPFASDYRPEALGQDRIAALAGTLGRFHRPRLVVDAGSCVTMDLMDAGDRHLGGNISPGVRMRLRAMHTFTARLPAVEPAPPQAAVGTTTEQALLHGAVRGVAYEIEGLFRRLAVAHDGLQLLLTGGDADVLRPFFTIEVHVYPNLVLRGLHHLLSTYVE